MSHPISAVPVALALLAAACSAKVPPSYRGDEITQGEIVESVSATGTVSALVTVSVGTQVSGTVARLHADYNSIVRRGQLLAELDPRLLRAALQRTEAALAAADAEVEKVRVALANAERTRERSGRLVQQNLVAQAELDAATADRDLQQATLKGAQARVLQARADRDTAATNLSLARIESPIDGIVISRNVDVGQTVAAAFQAPTLFTIANDLTRMQILANVDEADIGRISAGLETRFSVDAFPGESFVGRIREVRPAPTTVQNVVTYTAVIDAPNPDRRLRQGMTASVTVVTARRSDVLRLPNAALRWKPDPSTLPGSVAGGPEGPKGKRGEGRPAKAKGETALAAEGAPATPAPRRATVYRLDGSTPVPVEISLGLSDGRQTEVLSGLAQGDRVVVGEAGTRSGGAPPGAPGGPRRGLF